MGEAWGPFKKCYGVFSKSKSGEVIYCIFFSLQRDKHRTESGKYSFS